MERRAHLGLPILRRLGAVLLVGATGSVGLSTGCTPAGGDAPASEPVPVAPTPQEQTSGSETEGSDEAEARRWPSSLLVGRSEEPAKLYLGPDPSAAPVGFVYPGAAVIPKGAASGGRLPVSVRGPLEARGWLDLDHLAVRAQRTCRLGGSPAYLGPNDLVGVVGLDDRGLLRVRAEPGFAPQVATPLPAFEGVCPPDRFSADRVAPGATEGPSEGTPYRLPTGSQVPLYDRPGGQVVARLPVANPPLTVVVLRDQGEWKGVRVGTGPYLVGFVSVNLTPADRAPAAAPAALELPPSNAASVPEIVSGNSLDKPLWRVRAGTTITFDERAIGRLTAPGFAREMNRFDAGTVDVFVAADEGAAVRGMVPADALEALPAPAAGTGARAAPARSPASPASPAGGGDDDDDAPYVPGGSVRN